MTIGARRVRPQLFLSVFAYLIFACVGSISNALAAEKAEQDGAPQSKESFNLIVPFQDLTVGQGQEVTMDTEVVNRRKDPVEVSLGLDGVPKGWEVNFSSRYPSFPVRSVMVQGEKSTTIEFKAKVPENTKPGTYQVKVSARDAAGSTRQTHTVNFAVTSKKVETGGLRLTSQYPVLTAPSGQTLKFTVDLRNDTKQPLPVSLTAKTPPGWSVRFKPQFGDTQYSSILLKENASETVAVEIDTPAQDEAKEQPVTIVARSGAYEASANLKVSLKGTQDLKMGTLAGTLNTSVTAGKIAPVDFVVANAGTAAIRNLAFITKKPSDKWTIEFKPDKLDALNPGEVREIKMEILAPERTIAGDYLLNLTANSPEVNRSVEFRVTVSTPTVWGWVGFGIVALVVLGLAIVFFRLGRR